MNGLAWTLLVLAAMIGAVLCVIVGALVLVLLLANISERLTKDDHADHDD